YYLVSHLSMVMWTAIVEVGTKYRVTISQSVWRKTPLRVGQKVYLLARPPYIVLIPIPDKVDDALAELIGDITFSREERKKAEGQLLKEAS
ncbi:MAG: hypothetical protein QXL67_03070, partial [Candidatus Bathyarchaeia archaeon]